MQIKTFQLLESNIIQKMNVSNKIILEDLDHIFNSTASMWNELRGKQLFLTGATGFFGTWLLESFIEANRKLDLNAKVVVLTRNLDAFQKQSPHICSNPAIRLTLFFPIDKFCLAKNTENL